MDALKKYLQPAAEITSKEFDFPEGKATLHFKRLSHAEFVALSQGFADPDFAVKARAYDWIILKSLCNPDGSASGLTVEDLGCLKEEVYAAVLTAAIEIGSGQDIAGKS